MCQAGAGQADLAISSPELVRINAVRRRPARPARVGLKGSFRLADPHARGVIFQNVELITSSSAKPLTYVEAWEVTSAGTDLGGHDYFLVEVPELARSPGEMRITTVAWFEPGATVPASYKTGGRRQAWGDLRGRREHRRRPAGCAPVVRGALGRWTCAADLQWSCYAW